MISERISDDIPPQMQILNMAIPILMHFCSFLSIGALLVLGNYYFQLYSKFFWEPVRQRTVFYPSKSEDA